MKDSVERTQIDDVCGYQKSDKFDTIGISHEILCILSVH